MPSVNTLVALNSTELTTLGACVILGSVLAGIIVSYFIAKKGDK